MIPANDGETRGSTVGMMGKPMNCRSWNQSRGRTGWNQSIKQWGCHLSPDSLLLVSNYIIPYFRRIYVCWWNPYFLLVFSGVWWRNPTVIVFFGWSLDSEDVWTFPNVSTFRLTTLVLDSGHTLEKKRCCWLPTPPPALPQLRWLPGAEMLVGNMVIATWYILIYD